MADMRSVQKWGESALRDMNKGRAGVTLRICRATKRERAEQHKETDRQRQTRETDRDMRGVRPPDGLMTTGNITAGNRAATLMTPVI